MNDPLTILGLAHKFVGEKLENNDIIKRIDALYSKAKDKVKQEDGKDIYILDGDFDLLSSIISKLSFLLEGLGGIVADAMLLSNASYYFRKFTFAKTFTKKKKDISDKIKAGWKDIEKKTQGEIENETTVAIENEVEQEIIYKYYADVLKAKYDDVERFIRVCEQRIRMKEKEKYHITNTK